MMRSMDPETALARAQLAWLIELGAVDAIGEVPVDRYALAETRSPSGRAAPAAPVQQVPAPIDPVVAAADAANAAESLAALAAAMEAVPSPLRDGARRFVLADGTAGAHLMVIGEAPGRDEDIGGRPFLGEAGALLDRMLAAIGRDRADPDPARGVYIAYIAPWRPPGERLDAAEIERWRPFLARHVALAQPKVLLLMGNAPCLALLGRGGAAQIRGTWQEAAGLPAMPTLHPEFIVRIPDAETVRKRDARKRAWDDLQMVRDRLQEP